MAILKSLAVVASIVGLVGIGTVASHRRFESEPGLQRIVVSALQCG